MPAKQGGVITTGEARLIMKDKSTMKTALLCLQIEAGDRRDDPRLRNPRRRRERPVPVDREEDRP